MRVWFARRGPLASSTTLAPASCAAIAALIPAAPLPAISTSMRSGYTSVLDIVVAPRVALLEFLHFALQGRIDPIVAEYDFERLPAFPDVAGLLVLHVHALPGALDHFLRHRERYHRDAVVVTDHNVARADYQAADLHRHVDRARRVFLRGARADAAAERRELFLAQQADVAHAAVAHQARDAPVARLQRHVVAEGTGVILAAFIDHQHIARLHHSERLVSGNVVVGIIEDSESDANHPDRFEYGAYLRHHHAVAAHGIRDGGRPDAFEFGEQLLRCAGKVVMNVAVHRFFPGSWKTSDYAPLLTAAFVISLSTYGMMPPCRT